MTLNKRKRKELLALCGQLNEDDNVDPREYFRQRNRNDSLKTLRLCKQIADCLAVVLASEFEDELLQGLAVISVQPAPDAKRMLVVVQPDQHGLESLSPQIVLARVQAVAGRLRTEVASSITRKRAPMLSFQVLWPRTE